MLAGMRPISREQNGGEKYAAGLHLTASLGTLKKDCTFLDETKNHDSLPKFSIFVFKFIYLVFSVNKINVKLKFFLVKSICNFFP